MVHGHESKKVYVSCAITHAPQRHLQFVRRVQRWLRDSGLVVLEWEILPDRNDLEILDHDLALVEKSDLVLALYGHGKGQASDGRGIEIYHKVRVQSGQLLIGVQEGARASAMATGLARKFPHLCTKFVYRTAKDVVNATLTRLGQITQSDPTLFDFDHAAA